MIDLEKEKLKNEASEKQTNIKKEHVIIDRIKKDLTERKTEPLRAFSQIYQVDVMEQIINYLETSEKIYDPDYFIDFFCWYIKHSTIEGYNWSNEAKMNDLHLVVLPTEYCSFEDIIRESDIRTEYLSSDFPLHFVDLIITKYLKLILEKSDLNNLDKFVNFFLSLSYRYGQHYQYILYCVVLISRYKSYFTEKQINSFENLLFNLEFIEVKNEYDVINKVPHLMKLSNTMRALKNVPFTVVCDLMCCKFERTKTYPSKEKLEKLGFTMINYNDHKEVFIKIGGYFYYNIFVNEREYVPELYYKWLTNVSDENLYKHLDLILKLESPIHCYKILKEFELSDEYQLKLLEQIYDYDLNLHKKAIDMLSEKYKNNPKPTPQNDEIDYAKEIEKIRNMNILDIIDLLSKDELIYLQQLLKTDKPKINEQTKSLIKKLNK